MRLCGSSYRKQTIVTVHNSVKVMSVLCLGYVFINRKNNRDIWFS